MLISPNITYLADVYFGFGTIAALPGLLKKYSISNPLVVTDKGLVKAGIIERLGIDTFVVFDDVETNPTESMALAALNVYNQSGCGGIIAAGGGSSIDLAKCVALLAHHPAPLEQYAIVSGGISKITSNFPALIAVPTTAGSGSEIGRATLITVANKGKLAFLSNHLLPKAIICDPELTLSMPPLLTAATGMDALSHCVETFCSTRFNPVADAIALDGLERGYKNILKTTNNGADRKAREEMMMCSLQGGLAFQKGLGAVHSLSHPLGALTEKRLHHGTLNAIFLPFVLRFNFDHCREKMQAMAKRLKIENAYNLPDHFTLLNQQLNLPAKLRELKITKAELKPLAERAKADHCTPTNPRPLEIEDCRKLYSEAW